MAYDCIVIGGGIVGTAVAAHVASSGRSTLLLERAVLGAGASGRNSGVVQHPFDPVLIALYRESLERYRALGDRSSVGFALGDRPAGMWMATLDPDVAERLTTDLSATQPHLQPTFLPPGAVTEREPAIAPAVAACALDIGYPVEPLGATRAYAAWASELGVTIRERTAARPWMERGRARGALLDDGARVPAADVVVAAGPWSPALVDPSGAWRPIEALWGVVVSVELAAPPSRVIEEAWIDIEPPDPAAPPAESGGEHAFSLVTAGGRSSVGSTFLDAEPDPAAWVPALLERAAAFVPAIADAPVGPVRACARPLSRDGRPLIGPIAGAEGLWIAAGHGPWGISTGPAGGALIADLLDGRQDAPPAALDPGRFGPVPV